MPERITRLAFMVRVSDPSGALGAAVPVQISAIDISKRPAPARPAAHGST